MRAGARHIRHLLRNRGARLTMLALAATCSLPAAAQASDLPSVQHAAAGVTAQLGQTATAAGAVARDTTAPAQAAVQQTAAEVVAPARPAVEHAAETVTKTAAAPRPAVDTVVETVETRWRPRSRSLRRLPPSAPATESEPFAAPPPRGRSRSPRRHRNTAAETARPSEREPLPSVERAPRVAVHAERPLRHGRVRISRRRRERHLRTRCRRRIDGIGLFHCLQHRCRWAARRGAHAGRTGRGSAPPGGRSFIAAGSLRVRTRAPRLAVPG